MTSANISDLFDHNREWAAQMERDRPGFFTSLVKQQTPRYMWIGCSDSRVPANEIVDLDPGERDRMDRLTELNVVRQVRNVASDVFVQDAWMRGQSISVHGWVYSLHNGLITDLAVTVSSPGEIERLGQAPC